jgi:hypothetical protein
MPAAPDAHIAAAPIPPVARSTCRRRARYRDDSDVGHAIRTHVVSIACQRGPFKFETCPKTSTAH